METSQYTAFTRRILRAYVRRAEAGEVDACDLADLAALERDLDDALRGAVDALRHKGFSWSEIAQGLGTTKQAAHERFSSRQP